jgi:hypothetical protein
LATSYGRSFPTYWGKELPKTGFEEQSSDINYGRDREFIHSQSWERLAREFLLAIATKSQTLV